MNYIKQLTISFAVGLALTTSASAYEQHDEEQEQGNFATTPNLLEGAQQESIFGLVRHKGGGKWEAPEWLKKAAEKQKKQREAFQEYPDWDDYDDDLYNE